MVGLLGAGAPSHTTSGGRLPPTLAGAMPTLPSGAWSAQPDARTWSHCRGHAEQVKSTGGVMIPTAPGPVGLA